MRLMRVVAAAQQGSRCRVWWLPAGGRSDPTWSVISDVGVVREEECVRHVAREASVGNEAHACGCRRAARQQVSRLVAPCWWPERPDVVSDQ